MLPAIQEKRNLMLKEGIVFIDQYETLLKRLYKNSDKFRVPELEENEKLKFNLIFDLHFVNVQLVEQILYSYKKGKSGLLPILARTIFENSVNMTLIFVEDEKNGGQRFLKYRHVEEYKMYLKYKEISEEYAEYFLTSEELENAKFAYNEFKGNKFSLRDWFGKNLYECCEYLDQNHSGIIKSEVFFKYNYLQTYPFLSKSVHGLATSLETTKRIRGFWPFKKHHVFAHKKDHDISFLYHTISAYLSSLCIIGLITKNESFYLTHQSLLARHFFLYTNSLDKRNEGAKRHNIKPRKG